MATHDVVPGGEIRMTSQPCQVHNRHMPEPHVNHRHHIWPLGEGGPNIEDNIIAVCPTGHYNIHALIAQFKIHMGDVPYTVMRTYSYGERKFAELGYKRITRKSM